MASSYQWQVWSAIRVLTLLEEAGVEGKAGNQDSEQRRGGGKKVRVLARKNRKEGIVAAACAGVGGHQACPITTIETGLGEEQPAIQPWLWICTPHEPDKWASSTGGRWKSAGDQVTRMLEEVCAHAYTTWKAPKPEHTWMPQASSAESIFTVSVNSWLGCQEKSCMGK